MIGTYGPYDLGGSATSGKSYIGIRALADLSVCVPNKLSGAVAEKR
jgi:hypothetical protein